MGVQNIFNSYQKDFVANVSHDFRSPLTNIKGYIGAMLDGTIPHEIQEKYLKIILMETNRLTKLTEQLLELNKYENNGILLNYTAFDINEVIRNAASSFEKRCTEKKISIHLMFGSPSFFVDADRDKISQVVHNLIDNAVKFSSTDSSIEIQTAEQKGKIFVTVSDHGIGIPEASLPHIWDPDSVLQSHARSLRHIMSISMQPASWAAEQISLSHYRRIPPVSKQMILFSGNQK